MAFACSLCTRLRLYRATTVRLLMAGGGSPSDAIEAALHAMCSRVANSRTPLPGSVLSALQRRSGDPMEVLQEFSVLADTSVAHAVRARVNARS